MSDMAHPVEPLGYWAGKAAVRWAFRHLEDRWGEGVLALLVAGYQAMVDDLLDTP